MTSPLDESKIVGTIETNNDAEALAVCNKIDVVIETLQSIKSELGFPSTAPSSQAPLYTGVSAPAVAPRQVEGQVLQASNIQQPAGDDIVMPKKGERYRSSLSEAIKATKVSPGLTSH